MTVKITIPDEYYAGMRTNKDDVPLAFLTPNGTDKSSVNRINTVNSWAKGIGQLDPVVIKNVPLYGYRLTSSIRRSGQYGSGDRWYVEDPRGFQLEISSSNLAYIMQHCVIENGTILESCVWARQSGNNILLATSTDLYKTAKKFTDLSKSTESIKNIKIGNKVILQNGVEGIYLGKYHLLQTGWNNPDVLDWQKPQHVIVEYENNTCKQVHTFSAPKVSYISDPSEMTSKEAEEYLNKIIMKKENIISVYRPILAAVLKKPVSITMHLNVDPGHINALDNNKDTNYAVELKSGEFGLYENYGDDLTMKLVDISRLSEGKLTYIYQPKDPNINYYYRNPDLREKTFKRANVKNVYKLTITLKTKLGNEIVTEL